MPIGAITGAAALAVDLGVGVPVGSLAAWGAGRWWHAAPKCLSEVLCETVAYPELFGVAIVHPGALQIVAALVAGVLAAGALHLTSMVSY